MKINISTAILSAAILLHSTDARIVNECAREGQIGIVVDGYHNENGSKLLKALNKSKVNALFALDANYFHGEFNKSIVQKIAEKHEVGLKFEAPKNSEVASMTDADITEHLQLMKSRWTELHGLKLQFVVFPYTQDKTLHKRLSDLAEKEDLTVVSHSLYLDPTVTKAKRDITEHVFRADSESYIALLSGYTQHANEVFAALEERAEKRHFQLTAFSKCVKGAADIADTDYTLDHLECKGPTKKGKGAGHKTAKKTHKKKGNNKKKSNKNKPLVNPEAIRGYKSSKPVKEGKKKSTKNKEPLVDPTLIRGYKKGESKPDGKALNAALADPRDPDAIVDPKTERTKKAPAKEAEGEKVEAKTASNSSNSLSVPLLITVCISSVSLFLALF